MLVPASEIQSWFTITFRVLIDIYPFSDVPISLQLRKYELGIFSSFLCLNLNIWGIYTGSVSLWALPLMHRTLIKPTSDMFISLSCIPRHNWHPNILHRFTHFSWNPVLWENTRLRYFEDFPFLFTIRFHDFHNFPGILQIHLRTLDQVVGSND